MATNTIPTIRINNLLKRYPVKDINWALSYGSSVDPLYELAWASFWMKEWVYSNRKNNSAYCGMITNLEIAERKLSY